MAETSSPLTFDSGFDAQTGQPLEVLPGVVRLTAPNSGPYTFTGTNTYLLGRETVAVLDPGPSDSRHLEALRAAVGGRKVEAILLTHTHRDHSAAAWSLRRDTGAPLWFAGPHRLSRPARLFELNGLAWACDWRLLPDRTFYDGEVFAVAGMELAAVATPGHCANHMCFGIGGTDWLFSGDHIMGWNSTLVATPDGSMGDYLASMRKVIALPYGNYLPGHGGPVANGPSYARALLSHRELRNRQIVDAVKAGATSVSQLVGRIYPTISPMLKTAAAWTLKAHIEYLDQQGLLRGRRTLFGTRLSPA
jgi:glyoxylase-like metal-dependent hydrolase (beta-lactamase superfamily II)